MLDHELLERAAKAAGHEVEFYLAPKNCLFVTVTVGSKTRRCEVKFDPLNDDGDALRLAVKLNLSIVNYKNSDHTERRTSVKVWEGHDAFLFRQELHGSDPYAATRRAIVKAAAAMTDPIPSQEVQP